MRLVCLGSSSAGNCFYVELERGGGLARSPFLIEAGFPYSSIVRKLAEGGVLMGGIGDVFVSHSHMDHAKAAPDLAKRGIAIHSSAGTLSALGMPGIPMEPMAWERVGERLYAMAFPVEHDAPEPFGFAIKTDVEELIFGIDSRRWLADLSGLTPDYVFCEADYDGGAMDAEQYSLMKKAGDPEAARKIARNRRTIMEHMSLEGCVRTLSGLDLSRCKGVFLTHLSDRLASPSGFAAAVRMRVGVETRVCLKEGGLR